MIWLIIAIWILGALANGYFYHCGGLAQDDPADKWIPKWLRHSWCRDWICPLFSLITLLLFWNNAEWWKLLIAFIASYGLMGGAFSTYWDWVFGGEDNYFAHGFFIGLSIFPFAIIGMSWWIVLIQTIFISVAMGLWSRWISKVSVEECGRGFFASFFRII